ncbi:MAG: chorismate--pyruvate lyase [Clostridiales bacterium]|nr:chorismate--pyruvate lyase [Clostridiales bacterium]
MEAIIYEVEQIDGDYAHLRQVEKPEEENKLVARALLPEGIKEGIRLKYEWLEYHLIDME